MIHPQTISALSTILFNPYLLTIVGLGYVGIIVNHFKIYWRVKDYFETKRIIKNTSDEELKKHCSMMEDVHQKMLEKYPNHKRERFELACRKEHLKRFNELPSYTGVKQ